MLTSRSIGLFSSFFNCTTVHPFLICLTHNAVGWAGEAVFTSRAPRMELRILGTRSSCWSRKPVSKPACALYLAHGFFEITVKPILLDWLSITNQPGGGRPVIAFVLVLYTKQLFHEQAVLRNFSAKAWEYCKGCKCQVAGTKSEYASK